VLKRRSCVRLRKIDGEIVIAAMILGLIAFILAIVIMRVITGVQSGIWW
jgi:hypothetical protein